MKLYNESEYVFIICQFNCFNETISFYGLLILAILFEPINSLIFLGVYNFLEI